MDSIFPIWPPRASTQAHDVDGLMIYISAINWFFGITVVVLVTVFMIRYRRRRGMAEPDRVTRYPWWMEPGFMSLLGVVGLSMFIWGSAVFFRAAEIPARGLEITVVGKQWMWKFQHPQGQREINELHVPVDTDVKMTLATEDVIHSLYLPDFRAQMEVVPGRYTGLWFRATKVGTYHLFCSEYCGTSHSHMRGQVVVMEQADYQQWLQGGATESPATQGRKLFSSLGCAGCHAQGATAARCPNLEGLAGRKVLLKGGETVTADDAYLRESILYSQAKVVAGYEPIMPVYAGQISEEQTLALIAYIKSLGGAGEAGQPGASGGRPGGDDVPPAPPGQNPQIQKAPPSPPAAPRQAETPAPQNPQPQKAPPK